MWLHDSGVKVHSVCATGKQCGVGPGSGDTMETVMSPGLEP